MSTSGFVLKGDGTHKTLAGSAGDDAFAGSTGNETFLSGLGDDVVFAADGDDRVIADIGNDWLDGGNGTDTISFELFNYLDSNTYVSNFLGVTFDLSKTVNDQGPYLGIKTTYGFENIDGSFGDDRLFGNSGVNVIRGSYGHDLVDGRGNNDLLSGSFGSDTLTGGKGADSLGGYVIGSMGLIDEADIFRYKAVKESKVDPAARDTIWGGFNGGGTNGDRIDLGMIDANGSAGGNGTFSFIGTADFHANSTGEVQVRATANANEYLVLIDTDKDVDPEMSILVHSSTALVQGDFIL